MAECLEELELTDFAGALEGTELNSRLSNPDEELTVFAPTNEAISGRFLSQRTLTAHVVEEVVRNSDLRNGAVLQPVDEDTLLHITDIYGYSNMEFTEVNNTYIAHVCV